MYTSAAPSPPPASSPPPLDAAGWCERGAQLLETGDPDDAREAALAALALAPALASAWVVLARAEHDRGRVDAALHAWERAGAGAPGRPRLRLGRAMTRLLAGDWAGGFEDYEARLRIRGGEVTPAAGVRWWGEEAGGREVVLFAGQGLGDTLQMVRYAPLVAARGARVVVAAPPKLFHLLRRAPGVSRLQAAALPLQPDDLWAPLMSLPGLFGSRPDDVPPGRLTADPGRVASWRRRLDGWPRPWIGVVWRGLMGREVFTRRVVPVAGFGAAAAAVGGSWICLQRDVTEAERAAAPWLRLPPGELDGGPAFEDSAAILALVDHVVSSDTALAHLAGALGTPTALCLPFVPDWRWGLGGEQTAWYPSMRLFRQSAPGVWGDVLRRVGEHLATR